MSKRREETRFSTSFALGLGSKERPKQRDAMIVSSGDEVSMKKTLLIGVALALSAGSALAADLPSRKGPPPAFLPPPPPPMWTGFYVGLNAGGTWSSNNSLYTQGWDVFDSPRTLVGAAFANSATTWVHSGNNGGFIGGGQIGYNWQFNNVFVAGVEADIQGVTSHSGGGGAGFGVGFDPVSGASPATFTRVNRGIDYLGTVRGRLGYLVTPTLLAYGTGGLAYGGVNLNASYLSFDTAAVFGPGAGATSFSDTRVGWTAGGGLEWMFMPNWSTKVEYLYYDLGSVLATGAVVSGLTANNALGWAYAPSASARFNGHIVRAGLNYHFNWAPAPVVAKY
jgi:outer membrane immunogenic protein